MLLRSTKLAVFLFTRLRLLGNGILLRLNCIFQIQEDCANIHGMSQQTLSRLAQKVAIALACKSSQYIKMPSDIIEESYINIKFEDLCGMKNISGVIDCIHIKTRKVKSDLEYDFANRKGHSAISTQVCNNIPFKTHFYCPMNTNS